MNKAFFLDRDGTIIQDVHYINNVDDVELINKAAEAIKLMHQSGFKVYVVTNQGGIAKGLVTEQNYVDVNNQIQNLLYANYKIDGFVCCPHHPDVKKCHCRKPNALLINAIARYNDIDLHQSYMIGDKMSDVEAGINAGCKKSVLILTGHGNEYKTEAEQRNITYYNDLFEAVQNILGDNNED